MRHVECVDTQLKHGAAGTGGTEAVVVDLDHVGAFLSDERRDERETSGGVVELDSDPVEPALIGEASQRHR